MATTNSNANLITMTATNDTARTTQKLHLAGVLVLTTSLTAASAVRLTDAAGTLDIIPSSKCKSGAGVMVDSHYVTPVEVTGLKVVSASNVAIRVQLK